MLATLIVCAGAHGARAAAPNEAASPKKPVAVKISAKNVVKLNSLRTELKSIRAKEQAASPKDLKSLQARERSIVRSIQKIVPGFASGATASALCPGNDFKIDASFQICDSTCPISCNWNPNGAGHCPDGKAAQLYKCVDP